MSCPPAEKYEEAMQNALDAEGYDATPSNVEQGLYSCGEKHKITLIEMCTTGCLGNGKEDDTCRSPTTTTEAAATSEPTASGTQEASSVEDAPAEDALPEEEEASATGGPLTAAGGSLTTAGGSLPAAGYPVQNTVVKKRSIAGRLFYGL